MKVFWREQPLSADEANLLQLCLNAHAQSALRQNVSTAVLMECARGSGDYTKSLIGALSTLGAVHAPLMDTWRVLNMPVLAVAEAIKADMKIPGWGSNFAKEDEEIWRQVREHIDPHYPELWDHIEKITELLKEKNLKPNPSTFTAAVGIALKMPPQILPWIFVCGRLDAWTAMFLETTMKGGK